VIRGCSNLALVRRLHQRVGLLSAEELFVVVDVAVAVVVDLDAAVARAS